MWLFLQLHLQNGSVGNEELSAASVLARLGVTVDARGSLVRDRPAALLSGQIAVSNKENVMDEPKEEDEKKTAEVCMAEMWRTVCLCNRQRRPMVRIAVQATPNDGT